MEFEIDESACIGCRLCKDVCDAAFTMQGGVSRPVPDAVTPENLPCILDATAVCPTEAITFEQ